MKNSKNVLKYLYGSGAIKGLAGLLDEKRSGPGDYFVYYVDEFFKNNTTLVNELSLGKNDLIYFVSTEHEPTTQGINHFRDQLLDLGKALPQGIVGIGGGITLDTAKAVSNLLTNGGMAEDYQGWDLVKVPGVYKIGVPTLSGTGAEATRTCVMTNYLTGLKLGMNSEFTVYDQLVMDPDLTKTVPRNQYFYSGMDAYIHCVESLAGQYRHAVGDAFSHQTLALCKEVFLAEDMMADENREKMMIASYLGGLAIGNSFVGLVHPFSAGLSVALGIHHCIGNCIVMRGMDEFYPEACEEFWKMVDRQRVSIPTGIAKGLSEAQYEQLYQATIIHERPLKNALGEGFKDILTRDRVQEIFQRM